MDFAKRFILPEGIKAFSINPLNWRTDAEPAEADTNPGACFTDYSGQVLREEEGLCGCYFDTERGALQQNVETRIRRFSEK